MKQVNERWFKALGDSAIPLTEIARLTEQESQNPTELTRFYDGKVWVNAGRKALFKDYPQNVSDYKKDALVMKIERLNLAQVIVQDGWSDYYRQARESGIFVQHTDKPRMIGFWYAIDLETIEAYVSHLEARKAKG